MHQKNAEASSSAQSAEIEDIKDDDSRQKHEADDELRDPFGDDAAEDDGSDDGMGAGDGESWNSAGRGSWWRGALGRGGDEKFGDGRDDSDSDKERGAGDADEDDEEFGDFAMPEVDKDTGDSSIIVKPLPVSPPQQGGKGSSAFTSLWPFGSKEREKQKTREGEESSVSDSHSEVTGDDGGKIKSTHEAMRRTSIEDPDDEEVVV